MSEFKKSNIVIRNQILSFDTQPGIVLDTDINMWHEEVTPSGVKVMWSDGEIEILYEDEIEIYEPDELCDSQLEHVIGGMSSQSFKNWKTDLINNTEKT